MTNFYSTILGLSFTEKYLRLFFRLVIIGKNFLGIMSQDRKMYKCTCADCKKETEVPFEPKADRPVYCKECYQKSHQK